MASYSLFEPSQDTVLAAATDWVAAVFFGQVAVVLCILAVAFVGLLLMTGRMAIREAAKVVLGCFVLLGAPAIAAGISNVARSVGATAIQSPPVVAAPTPAPVPLPPANYDPYAGASLRTE